MSEEIKEKTEITGDIAPSAGVTADAEGAGDGARFARGNKPFTPKPKKRPCSFCANKIKSIDYKDVTRLKKYITEKGKIIARRQTGLCARHQREITQAIKRARNMSLL